MSRVITSRAIAAMVLETADGLAGALVHAGLGALDQFSGKLATIDHIRLFGAAVTFKKERQLLLAFDSVGSDGFLK